MTTNKTVSPATKFGAEFPIDGFFNMKMTLDGVEHRFHVRECDNRVAIVLTQPGWAAANGNDYWYVSIEDLKSTGAVDEGQDVERWEHRPGSTHPGGVGRARAIEIAKELYQREALKPYRKAIKPMGLR